MNLDDHFRATLFEQLAKLELRIETLEGARQAAQQAGQQPIGADVAASLDDSWCQPLDEEKVNKNRSKAELKHAPPLTDAEFLQYTAKLKPGICYRKDEMRAKMKNAAKADRIAYWLHRRGFWTFDRGEWGYKLNANIGS